MNLFQRNGVSFYRSDLIPCPHGFSTRLGGVSEKEHTSSLNLAFGRGDDAETVLENLARFGNAAGFEPASVVSLPQIHGNNVLYISPENRGEGYSQATNREADGYVTDSPEVTLGIKTADCVPILLCGLSEEGIPIAVSAVHAGWRGTVSGIAKNGVRALTERGIRPENIRAAIGPAIDVCCYEVDNAFYERFCEEFGKAFLNETFLPSKHTEGKYYANLKEINRRILVASGVPEENIDVCTECTCCHPELFFSHRYTGGLRGTMLSVIALPHSSDAP